MVSRFLFHMVLRNLAAFDRLPRQPLAGSRNAAIFGTGLWLSMVAITALTLALVMLWDSLPPRLNPLLGRAWLYFALWIPILFACDRYVEALVRQHESGLTSDQLNPPLDPRDV